MAIHFLIGPPRFDGSRDVVSVGRLHVRREVQSPSSGDEGCPRPRRRSSRGRRDGSGATRDPRYTVGGRGARLRPPTRLCAHGAQIVHHHGGLALRRSRLVACAGRRRPLERGQRSLKERGRLAVAAERVERAAERVAHGRHVLLLNSDTIVRPDTLRTLVGFMDDHPDAGAAGCRINNPDGTLQLDCRRSFPTPSAAFYKLTGLGRLFPKSRRFARYNLTYLDPDEVNEVDALSGSCMIVRRQVLDEVGGFDEAYFMYGEDLDWCFRMREAGWKIYYTPATEIILARSPSWVATRVTFAALPDAVSNTRLARFTSPTRNVS